MIDRATVERWLADYVAAWKSYDREAIAALYAEDAECRYHPYDEPIRGRTRSSNRGSVPGRAPRAATGRAATTPPTAPSPSTATSPWSSGTSTYTDPPAVYDNCFAGPLRRLRALPRVHGVVHGASPLASRAMPDDGIFYDADANPDALKGKTIAILGYGSQGHAHALNLKESGYDVVVGLRADSSSRAKAEAAGLEVARRPGRREPRRRGHDPAARREAGRGLGDRDLRRRSPRATCSCSRTASRSTSARSTRRPGSTSAWWRRRGRGISSAASTRRARACPA